MDLWDGGGPHSEIYGSAYMNWNNKYPIVVIKADFFAHIGWIV